jgi:pSer/pThr/pTyr-binding forkhead associated (FHA) protein
MSLEAHLRIGSLEITAALMAVAAIAVRPRNHYSAEVGSLTPLKVGLRIVEFGNTRSVDVVCPAVVGRASDAGLTLADSEVSRRHLRFETGGGVVYVRDLASSNGTFLNGRRLKEAIEVRPGDAIDIGVTRLIVEEIAPWT